jgi:phosphoribosylamine--glycine ligase
LQGQELSAFALCDGKEFVVLGTACDYKRITPDPYSANTGGMGAFSPCDFITDEDDMQIQEIFQKSLNHLHDLGIPFQGFLFAGLMKTNEGLFVLEYNVRMGDPETQALMPRIRSDLGKLIFDAVNHDLKAGRCEFADEVSVHVVATSQGYPQADMNLGHAIHYPLPDQRSSIVYFSGVSLKDQKLINTGGRVLGLTALAKTKQAAREIVYKDLQKIKFEGMYSRQDIGS